MSNQPSALPAVAAIKTTGLSQTVSRVLNLNPIHAPTLLTISLLLPVLVFTAAAIDKTLWMTGHGVGLLQHYGFLVIFTTTPLLVLATWRLVSDYTYTLATIDQHFAIDRTHHYERRLIRHARLQFRILGLQGPKRYILNMLMLAGALAVLSNMLAAQQPVLRYGHDVFDAAQYHYGYTAAKLYLAFIWIIVYPISFFYAAFVEIGLWRLQVVLCDGILKFEPFHPDGCGGTGRFGSINIKVMAVFTLPWLTAIGLYTTHRKEYGTLLAGGLVMSALGTWVGVFGVWPARQFVARERRRLLNEVAIRIREAFESGRPTADLFAFQKRVQSIRVSAYRRAYGEAAPALGATQAVTGLIGIAGRILDVLRHMSGPTG
jgi:hypothetical protein